MIGIAGDTTFKFLVKGVIANVGEISDLSLNVNKDEVNCYFTLSIEELLASSKSTKFRGSKRSPYYPSVNDYEFCVYDTSPRVWGLSAIYTNFLLSILTNGEEKFIGGLSGAGIDKLNQQKFSY